MWALPRASAMASWARTPDGRPRSMPTENTWRARAPPPVERISLWWLRALPAPGRGRVRGRSGASVWDPSRRDHRSDVLAVEGAGQVAGDQAVDDLDAPGRLGRAHELEHAALDHHVVQLHGVDLLDGRLG